MSAVITCKTEGSTCERHAKMDRAMGYEQRNQGVQPSPWQHEDKAAPRVTNSQLLEYAKKPPSYHSTA